MNLSDAIASLPLDEYNALLSAFNSGDSYMSKLDNGKFVAVNIPADSYKIIENKGCWFLGEL